MIQETVRQIQQDHPKNLQAGPAFRGDLQTMEKHRELLSTYPGLTDLYACMSKSIAKHFEKE